MAWVRLDDKRAINRKLMQAGLEARGLDEAAICYAAMQESDGYVSAVDVAMLAAGHGCVKWRQVVERLVEVGRWAPTPDGWQIHDYLEFNPSRAQAEDRRKRDRIRKDSAGNRRGTDTDADRNPCGADPESSRLAGARPRVAAGAHSRAPSRPVPEVQNQDPALGVTHDTGGPNRTKRDPESEKRGTTPAVPVDPLLAQLEAVCTGKNRATVRFEAVQVLGWARTHFDRKVIEEALGYAAGLGERPVLPRAVAGLLQRKADDYELTVPPFQPIAKAVGE